MLILLPLLFVQCGLGDAKVYESAESMVADQATMVTMISVEDVNTLVDSKAADLKIVDVRESDEFEAGHIPGAINVPRGLLEFSPKLTNRRDRIIVYSNQQNRSVLSFNNLKLLKFRDVTVLEGGFEQWQAAYPEKIEEGSGSTESATPAPKPASGGCGG